MVSAAFSQYGQQYGTVKLIRVLYVAFESIIIGTLLENEYMHSLNDMSDLYM